MTEPHGVTSSGLRRRLNAAHSRLLDIHKALLEQARVGYERLHGAIPSPGAFLQHLINDPYFAWLRPMTTLIVQIDEFAEGDDPLDAAAGEALLAQARELLSPEESGTDFQRGYAQALHESAQLGTLHAQWRQAQQPANP